MISIKAAIGLFLFAVGITAATIVLCVYPAKSMEIPQDNGMLVHVRTFVNMQDEDIINLKHAHIVRMLKDTANAYSLKPYVFCGLSYYESDRFKQANKRRKDSNGRWSYGLFQIQLETALLYDKTADEGKLLTPAYNMHIAALIFSSNLAKYKYNYDMAIAAHNAGTIFNGQIKNAEFVKRVYTSTGEFAVRFDPIK